MHAELLARYSAACGAASMADVPDDGYFLQVSNDTITADTILHGLNAGL